MKQILNTKSKARKHVLAFFLCAKHALETGIEEV